MIKIEYKNKVWEHRVILWNDEDYCSVWYDLVKLLEDGATDFKLSNK